MANSFGQFSLWVSVSHILKSQPSCTSHKPRASFQRWQVWWGLVHGKFPHAASQSSDVWRCLEWRERVAKCCTFYKKMLSSPKSSTLFSISNIVKHCVHVSSSTASRQLVYTSGAVIVIYFSWLMLEHRIWGLNVLKLNEYSTREPNKYTNGKTPRLQKRLNSAVLPWRRLAHKQGWR